MSSALGVGQKKKKNTEKKETKQTETGAVNGTNNQTNTVGVVVKFQKTRDESVAERLWGLPHPMWGKKSTR